MPRLSQWYIRSAFIYLFLGFTIGALLLANKGVPIHPALWGWLPIHIEFLLIGWTLQLILGMAFWILPRFWEAPRRGNVKGAYIAFILLNAGVLLIMSSRLLNGSGWWLVLGRLLELGAVLAFAHAIWSRIVSRDG